ncbi:FAD-binding domain-containing protein [Xylariaceae sp. FL0255]|nr:FAD-binding domain-containing protein [Xylariaceae sp. FL0255]
MTTHWNAVRQIAQAVRSFYNRRESFRIFHGSTNSTRPRPGGPEVDISALSHIIEVNRESQSALVEPNVPMDKLVAATLREGLIPPVVMEFPGITAGGGFAGSSAESSSFKQGYFHETVKSIEMVLGNGDIVTASDVENRDLFTGAAGALGTLGITTLLELRLVPAKRFVHATYHRTHSVEETLDTLKTEVSNLANDYVDGVMFSDTFGVVITGIMTNDLPQDTVPRTFSGSWDLWYYLHLKNKDQRSEHLLRSSDYLPLPEYLFRWDRGGFWVGKGAFDYFGFIPFNKLNRWFLDDFMHTRMLYRALHGSNESFGYMVQDLSLPYSTTQEFISYAGEELNIWPLWLCPLREIEGPTFHPFTTLPGPDEKPKPMVNIGVWGQASRDLSTFVRENRRMEQVLRDLGGRKVLYAHTYYTEDEFWELYDKKWYENLRDRYQARSLPTIYDKIKPDLTTQENRTWTDWLKSIWPLPGVRGVAAAIRSRDYIFHRNKPWKYTENQRDPS